MKNILIKSAPFLAAWVLISFVGVMFDTARANFWTQSLMASLMASVLFAPIIVFLGRPRKKAPAAPPEAKQPFVESSSTLWPDESAEAEAPAEATERTGWPYNTDDVASDSLSKKETA